MTDSPALLFILFVMIALHQLASCHGPLVAERDPHRERGTMKIDGQYWERP